MMFGQTYFGDTYFGSVAGAGSPPSVFSVRIAGADRTTYVEETFSLTTELCARGALELEFVDIPKTYDPAPGERIDIFIGSALYWAGMVETVTLEPYDTPTILAPGRVVIVRGSDWMKLPERYYLIHNYVNENLRAICLDVINNQTPLHEDGVTLGDDVPVGLTLSEIPFDNKKASAVFQELAELNGFCWYIDVFKVLHFYEGSSIQAPFGISDATPNKYFAVSLERSLNQYRNVQILDGGVLRTDPKTETKIGDGKKTTWNLRYDVNQAPTIKLNGVVQKIGVRGEEDEDQKLPEGPRFFYRIGDNEISQNDSRDEDNNPDLTAADILEISYIGQFPMRMKGRRQAKIDERKNVEGGSGIYENLEKDTDLVGLDFSLEKIGRLLDLYGRVPAPIQFSTHKDGFAPGQTFTVDLADIGLASVEYMVNTVALRIIKLEGAVELLSWEISAIDGPRLEGWQGFFQRQAAAGREFVGPASSLIIPVQFNEVVTFSDTLKDSENDSVTLSSANDDPFTKAHFGSNTQGNHKIPRFKFGRSKFGVPA